MKVCKTVQFITFIVILAILPGCWDSREIDENVIVTLVGVDRTDDRQRFIAEYASYDSANIGSGCTANLSKIIEAEGFNLSEARVSAQRKSPFYVYMGAVRGVVFSKSYAKNGIEDYVNRVRNFKGYRKTADFYTTNTDIDEFFRIGTSSHDNMGFDLENMSEHMVKRGLAYSSVIKEVMEYMLIPNTGYLLNNVDLVGTSMELTGYSIMNDNKKIGFLGSEQMKGVNFIILMNTFNEYTFDFMDTKVTLSAKTRKKKVDVRYGNEEISFDIDIIADSMVMHFAEFIMIDRQMGESLGIILSDLIKKDITDTIDRSQKVYGCDYLDFYKHFRAKYRAEFERMNWNERYKNAKFNVDVTVEVLPVKQTAD